MTSTTDRLLGFIAAGSFLAVGVALVSQHYFDMPPCAYCVFQRLLFVAIGACALIALALQRARAGRVLFTGLIAALSVGGIAAAWYQHTVAANLLTCAQTFADRFMTQSGLEASMPAVFGIYASCADASVDLLGVKYELWSLALFALLGMAALVVLGRELRASRDSAARVS